MVDYRPSLADAALINAATALILLNVQDLNEEKMLLDCIAETVNAANWDHPHVGQLVVACRVLLDVNRHPIKGVRQQCMVEMMNIEAALRAVARWRLGDALEQYRNRKVA